MLIDCFCKNSSFFKRFNPLKIFKKNLMFPKNKNHQRFPSIHWECFTFIFIIGYWKSYNKSKNNNSDYFRLEILRCLTNEIINRSKSIFNFENEKIQNSHCKTTKYCWEKSIEWESIINYEKRLKRLCRTFEPDWMEVDNYRFGDWEWVERFLKVLTRILGKVELARL